MIPKPDTAPTLTGQSWKGRTSLEGQAVTRDDTSSGSDVDEHVQGVQSHDGTDKEPEKEDHDLIDDVAEEKPADDNNDLIDAVLSAQDGLGSRPTSDEVLPVATLKANLEGGPRRSAGRNQQKKEKKAKPVQASRWCIIDKLARSFAVALCGCRDRLGKTAGQAAAVGHLVVLYTALPFMAVGCADTLAGNHVVSKWWHEMDWRSRCLVVIPLMYAITCTFLQARAARKAWQLRRAQQTKLNPERFGRSKRVAAKRRARVREKAHDYAKHETYEQMKVREEAMKRFAWSSRDCGSELRPLGGAAAAQGADNATRGR